MIAFEEEAPSSAVEATKEEQGRIHDVQEVLSHAAVAPESTAYLVGPDGKGIALPKPLFRILRHAAAMLAHGERVTLASVTKELSTQEAADLLGVSRPYVIKLLDAGDIPFKKVGRHRRVTFGDVNDYRKKRDSERRERILDLIRKSEEMGLYDIEEFDLAPTR